MKTAWIRSSACDNIVLCAHTGLQASWHESLQNLPAGAESVMITSLETEHERGILPVFDLMPRGGDEAAVKDQTTHKDGCWLLRHCGAQGQLDEGGFECNKYMIFIVDVCWRETKEETMARWCMSVRWVHEDEQWWVLRCTRGHEMDRRGQWRRGRKSALFEWKFLLIYENCEARVCTREKKWKIWLSVVWIRALNIKI